MASPPNAFRLPVSTFAQELQRDRNNAHKPGAGAYFHVTGGAKGSKETARRAALKKTPI